MDTKKHLLLLSCLGTLFTGGCTKNDSVEAEKKTAYIPVKKAPLNHQMKWRGIVRAANRIEVRADRKIKVKKTLVKNFDTVKKGQPILEVDNSETITKYNELVEKKKSFDLEMQTSRLKHEHTVKVLGRKKTLLDKGIIAQKEYDDALRESKVSETEIKAKQLEESRLQKEMAEIEAQLKSQVFLAPMAGSVSNLMSADPGASEAQPGQLLAVVSDLSSLALWVPVEETNIHRVSPGAKALVRLDNIPGEELPGKVIEVSTNTSQNSGRIKTYEVGIGFSTKAMDLREGYGGEAVMVVDKRDSAIAVPMSALKYSDGKNFVLVADSENAEGSPREVSLGIKTETEAEVVKGLSEGEYLVVDAQ